MSYNDMIGPRPVDMLAVLVFKMLTYEISDISSWTLDTGNVRSGRSQTLESLSHSRFYNGLSIQYSFIYSTLIPFKPHLPRTHFIKSGRYGSGLWTLGVGGSSLA